MPEAKVALVTGAGRGIGRDIALRLSREGYACGLIARTKSQLEETADLIRAQGGKALVTPTDVSKREQVLAAVDAVERELGPISVLINNAGAYLRKRFTDITEDEFDFQLKVNAYGPFFCTQAVVGRMADRGGGTVIFVLGSESRGGPAQYSAYTASKLAQRAIAESVAYEFMHLGVHSATLDVDGAVDSPRVREAMPDTDPSQFVSPEAICNEIVHLIGQPKSSWTFGVDLRSFAQWRPRAAAARKPAPKQ
ncbi:MAG TPA: SDR family NAD(P)-dependent oxidoreductase [Candidatus Binataceae bacterium]|nr:SDR family NAD(P)-dependent oxidoreductase [Candidatus Binataceae bacterium]